MDIFGDFSYFCVILSALSISIYRFVGRSAHIMDFKLTSEYEPYRRPAEAIAELVAGVKGGQPYQTLLGVTGSGKTFTMANVIQQVKRPTLILSHNKTLAAQLYSEMKNFFPEKLCPVLCELL